MSRQQKRHSGGNSGGPGDYLRRQGERIRRQAKRALRAIRQQKRAIGSVKSPVEDARAHYLGSAAFD